MTLLDAPKFDEVRDRRNRMILSGSAGLVFVLLVGLVARRRRPVDWPWNWNTHLLGRMAVNNFLDAVEQNDLQRPTASGCTTRTGSSIRPSSQVLSLFALPAGLEPHQPRQRVRRHPEPQNRGGALYGNVLLVAVLINGRKSGALNLTYDPKTHTLNFSPPGEEINPELYLGSS